MGKIKRGISLLLCGLLLGSILTAGSVTDVQASKQQTDTVTQQAANNTDTTKEVSDDQTSDKAGQNEEKDTGDDAQTDTVESKETFFVLPVYTEGTTAISTDREEGIEQIMAAGFTDRNFAAAVYDSLLEAGWMGKSDQSVKEVLGSFTGEIKADGYARKIVYIVTAKKVVFDPLAVTDINETFDTWEEAKAFYDSLKNIPGVEEYAEKKITEGKTTLDTQKPEDELIKNIEGIEWLRKAERIDLKNNRISDITPLSKANIMKAAEEEGIAEDIIDGKGWFGIEGTRNTELSLAFNPITLMPEFGAGRLLLEDLQNSSKIETKGELVYINPVEENLKGQQYNISLPIPLIEKEVENSESRRVQLNEDSTVTKIDSSTTRGKVSVPYEETESSHYEVDTKDGTVLPVVGILSSGHIHCATATTSDDGIMLATFSEGDLTDSIPDTPYIYRFDFDQIIRIYSKIIPKVQLEITLKKTVADTDESRVRPVEGAEFELHKATKNPDGTFAPGEKIGESYTTDKEGKITAVGEFSSGDYCFVEVEAPKGFELNEKPIGFSISTPTVTIGGGQSSVTLTDESGDPGQTVDAEAGSTFFDRYSPDVTVNVPEDDADIKLKKIGISYYDWEKDKESVETYNNTNNNTNNSASETAKKAAQFINAKKGNEKECGNIDSTVIVQSVFEKTPVVTENKRKTVDFEFVKKDSLSKKPMAGVEFSLTCNHKHDEECQYDGIDEASCMHSHNDKEGCIDPEGCTWSKTVQSNENGIVKFEGLLSGEYELEEKATLDGFVLPGGTWILTVNTDPDKGEKEIQIEKKDKNDSTTPEFEENEKGELVVENEPKIPFSFIKVDEKTGDPLAGAEFTLYQGDENAADNWSMVGDPVVSSEEGIVDFGRLKQGEYFLKETKAPKGYLKPTGYWKVTIAVTDDASKKVTFKARGDVPAISGNHIEGFKVSNRETSLLPKMGGNGTKIFVFSGFMIICCSLVLYFRFKRKGA